VVAEKAQANEELKQVRQQLHKQLAKGNVEAFSAEQNCIAEKLSKVSEKLARTEKALEVERKQSISCSERSPRMKSVLLCWTRS